MTELIFQTSTPRRFRFWQSAFRNCCSFGVLVCLFSIDTLPLVAQEQREVIPAVRAIDRAGERTTIEMTVENSNLLDDRDRPICFLNSMRNFRSEQNFTVVIYSEGLRKFKQIGIENPATHFRDKKIQVRGEVTLRSGRPQIVVEFPGQIELVQETAAATDAVR